MIDDTDWTEWHAEQRRKSDEREKLQFTDEEVEEFRQMVIDKSEEK